MVRFNKFDFLSSISCIIGFLDFSLSNFGSLRARNGFSSISSSSLSEFFKTVSIESWESSTHDIDLLSDRFSCWDLFEW